MNQSASRTKMIAALKKHGAMSAAEASKATGMKQNAARLSLRRLIDKGIAESFIADGKPGYALKGEAPKEYKTYPIHNYGDPYALPPAFFGARP